MKNLWVWVADGYRVIFKSKPMYFFKKITIWAIIYSLLISTFIMVPNVLADDWRLEKLGNVDGGVSFGVASYNTSVTVYVLKDNGSIMKILPGNQISTFANTQSQNYEMKRLAVAWDYNGNPYIGVLYGSYPGSAGTKLDIYDYDGSLMNSLDVIGGYDITAYKKYFYLATSDGLFKSYVSGSLKGLTDNDTYKRVVAVDGGILGLGTMYFYYYMFKKYKTDSLSNDIMPAGWVYDGNLYIVAGRQIKKVELVSLSVSDVGIVPVKPRGDDIYAFFLYKDDSGYVYVSSSGVYVSQDGKSWDKIYNATVKDVKFFNGKVYFLTSDGVYYLTKNVPLQVSVKPYNFSMDLVQVGKDKPYLEIVNKENEPVYVECKSDKSWLKPSWDGAFKIDGPAGSGSEGGEAEKTEFDVILVSPDGAGLFDHYPNTPTTGATVSCHIYTQNREKEINVSYQFELKLPQLQFKQLLDTIVYDGSQDDFAVIEIVNKGMGTATLQCKTDKKWADVQCPSKVAPNQEVRVILVLKPELLEKATSTLTIHIGPYIWARDYHFTIQRTDIPQLNIYVSGETEVQYEEMSSWHPVLVFENMGSDISLDCSSNMDWMLPDSFSLNIGQDSTATMALMPRQSKIDEHWPTTPKVDGYYTCDVFVSDKGNSVQLKSPTLTVLLPQVQVEPVYTYDIEVPESGGKITLANLSNTGLGYALLSYQSSVDSISLEYPSRLNPGESGQLKVVVPPGKGELLFNITGKYGYSGSFHIIYTSNQQPVKVIQTVFTIPMLIKNAGVGGPYVHAVSNIDDYQIEVEDENGNHVDFIQIRRIEEKDAAGNTITYGTPVIDKKHVRVGDIKLPETKVVLVVKQQDKVIQRIPITIKVNSAIKLLVPKDRMVGDFYRWGRDNGWKKKQAGNLGAPFVHPKYWRTYVPLRLVSQELGLKITWDGKERKIKLESEEEIIVMDMKEMLKQIVNLFGKKETIYESANRKVVIYTKQGSATGYGRSVYVDPSIIYRGRTYVPVRFIAEEIKSLVIWDGSSRSVWIYR